MSVRITYNEAELRESKEVNGPIGYRQCSVSLMDTIRTDLNFDEEGRCHHYHRYHDFKNDYIKEGETGQAAINAAVVQMKNHGANKKYDCILGVSGGVDSTYLALLAKRLDLRVLCVHFDNGWNSELATENIENIVSKCGFDLYTYVMDWEEFRAIQLAYFKSHVIDIEAVTDIAIFAALDKVCRKFGLTYILDGRNFKTESVLGNWVNKNPNNLLNIAEAQGPWPLEKFPIQSRWDLRTKGRNHLKKINFPFLDWTDYYKPSAKMEISSELGWRDYGGKHYESVFTRFYQGYILPEKFKVDKRKAHLSNLIFSGQISREDALVEIASPIYNQDLLKEDFQFVRKKLGFSESEFYAYIDEPEIPHAFYGETRSYWKDWRQFRLKHLI